VASYIRGNIIRWTTTPYDVDGVAVVPSAVTLSVIYRYKTATSNRPITRDQVEIDMTPDAGSTWVAEWDSSVAIPGSVNWTIHSTGPSSADKGSFDLT